MTETITQDQWRNTNPLRQWRDKQSPALLRADVAASTGLGLSTIANIEAGATPLSPRNRDAIAKLMGEKPETVEGKWKQWFAANPLLKGASKPVTSKKKPAAKKRGK